MTSDCQPKTKYWQFSGQDKPVNQQRGRDDRAAAGNTKYSRCRCDKHGYIDAVLRPRLLEPRIRCDRRQLLHMVTSYIHWLGC